MADSLAEDLKQHIYQTYENGPRRDSHWVMNPEWFNACRQIETPGGVMWHPDLTVSAPEAMLGIPVEVRDDGGPPHLELDG
jgi:HK97 family phage major capsid protein